MSVDVMSWVWKHSEATGNARLVLLALADCCDDEGANAWPSLDTLAAKARVSRRTAIRCVQELASRGAIEVVRGGGRRGRGGTSNGYRVLLTEDAKRCQIGTGDRLALVTNQVERGDTTDRSGDTGGTRTHERKNRPGSKRATTAPDSFDITADLSAWAAGIGIRRDLSGLTDQWLDYHRAKGSKFKDWTASWRTWMRNEMKYHPERHRAAPASAGTHEEPY